MMQTNRQRIRESLGRIEAPELRQFVAECIGVAESRQYGAVIPSKKYRELIQERMAGANGTAPEASYAALSEQQLTERATNRDARRDSAESSERPMRLQRLELNNFGSFHGEHPVELSSDRTRNTTVFVGGNGTGKSTTFAAINWALFSGEYLNDLLKLTGKGRQDLINEQALSQMREHGGRVETSVTLWFTTSQGSYRISRKIEARYLDDGSLSLNEPQAVLYRIGDDGNHDELPEHDYLPSILRDIPRTAREFYLFDGEQVDQFTADDSHTRIRAAIEKIIGMEIIRDAMEELRTTQEDISSELRRNNKDEAYQAAAAEVDRLETEITERTSTIEDLEEQIFELERHIKKLEEYLRNTADTQELQAKRDELEEQLQVNEARRTEVLAQLRAALNQTYSCLALPAVSEFAEDLRKLDEEGTLSGGINPGLLKELLGEEQCVCGRPLGHDTEAANHLQELLVTLESQSPINRALMELRYSLPSFMESLKEEPDALVGKVEEYSALWDERAKLRDQREAISEQIGTAGTSRYQEWEKERKDASDQRDRLKGDALLGQHELKKITDDHQAALAKAKRLSEQNQQVAGLSEQLEWADAGLQVLKALDEEFAAIARLETNHRTVQLWNRLLPNVSHYKVEITGGFEMKVTSPTGMSSLAQLSMGQRQCLGLAFVTAIAQVAGTKPPIVVDMPFGKLDGDVAAELAVNLPQLADQLILFLLAGNEWNEDIRKALEPSTRRIVHLQQEANRASRYVVEGEQ